MYGHSWVRLASCQLFGLFFSSFQPDAIAIQGVDAASEADEPQCYIARRNVMFDLSKEFCNQLLSDSVDKVLSDQVHTCV